MYIQDHPTQQFLEKATHPHHPPTKHWTQEKMAKSPFPSIPKQVVANNNTGEKRRGEQEKEKEIQMTR